MKAGLGKALYTTAIAGRSGRKTCSRVSGTALAPAFLSLAPLSLPALFPFFTAVMTRATERQTWGKAAERFCHAG